VLTPLLRGCVQSLAEHLTASRNLMGLLWHHQEAAAAAAGAMARHEA
jgi:hypothetical protein